MPPPRWRAAWVFSSCAARGDVRQGVAAGRRLLPARRKACALRSPALRPTCGSTQQSTVYGDGSTANGGAGAKDQPIKTIAHDGTVTFYAYTAKGQEAERATFAASYASSSTRPALSLATTVTSTQWHATWNLPTKIAEPNKITAFTYANANATTGMGAGNLTGRSETQTTDATGAAKFTATQAANTAIKSTGWSYSSTNLPTTIVERETPYGATAATQIGKWTYAYNSLGDTTSVKDVQITPNPTGTFTTFNAAGLPLTGKATDGRIFTIGYRADNQIQSLTMSDGYRVTYSYNTQRKLSGVDPI
jgi:hypothetical protein